MTDNTIDTMLLEERRYEPDPDFARQANAQPGIYGRDWEEFWETEGRARVTWFEPFSKLYEWEPPYAKWYLGGKLNVTYNCVDRHVEVEQHYDLPGLRGCLTSRVRLHDVRVPRANLLGAEGQGAALTRNAFLPSGASIGIFAVAAMRGAFGIAHRFATTETRGGAVPIIVRSVGPVGVAVVSGLPQFDDHQMVVAALRAHLAAG